MSNKPRYQRKAWTEQEELQLVSMYADTPMDELVARFQRSVYQIYNKAHILNLHRSTEFMRELAFKSQLAKHGESTRFKKGQIPVNKGMKGMLMHPNAVATQFKPGTKPPNHRPVGTIRFMPGIGYLEIKVAEGNRMWKLLHRLIYERMCGPIPRDMCLIFRDKNPMNLSICNLELVTKQENMRRNSVHRYGKEIAYISQLQAAITRQINKYERKQDDGHQQTA